MTTSTVTMSEEIGKVSAALVKAQEEVETALKASTNPHYGSSYADLTSVLGVIKPALATHGLAMVQYPGYEDGIVTMTTILVHESGEWIQSPVAAIPITKQDPHGATSGVTYLRRTCASSLMALIADDDDGNAAVGPAPKPTKPTKPTKAAKAAKPITKKKVAAEANHLAEQLGVLEALVSACEEHGGVDHKVLTVAQSIVADWGPLDRVEKAIKHLEMAVSRG
jgi:predicted secreted protein